MTDINASAIEVTDPHAHVDARIGLLGDPHADFHWTKQAIEQLLSLGVKQIHVLGDFQFVGRKLSREKQTLRRLSNMLKAGDAHMFVTGGNHEGYPALFRRYPADEHGYRRLDAHITWLPRGWRGSTDAGTIVASLGGANSIDRDQRNPPATGLIGQWWPEEQITEEDLAALGREPVDVLLAHDAPPTQKLKKQLHRHRGFWSPEGRAYADAGQQMFQRGVEQVRPSLVLSGHYHRFLDTTETFRAPNGEAFEVRSIILNRSRRTRSIAVLSVDTQEFEFPDASPATKAPPVITTAMARQQAADLAVRLSPAVQRALIRLLKTAYEQGLSDEELVSMLDLLTRVLVDRVAFDRRALRTFADDLVWAGLYTAEEVAAADQQPHGENLRALVDKAWDRTVEETFLTAEVAGQLGISDSTVRRRAAENRLYSFPRGGKRRYPTWQFVSSGDQPLPHLSELLAAVPWRMSWSVLRAFMISPKETLRAAPTPDSSSPSRISPADWLSDGRDVQAVVKILSTHPVHRDSQMGEPS